MNVKIPDDLKKDVPQSTFGKILTATPVVMAVLATMLAGLASSEMTRAQYDRSLAAQQQSKAGDQWSFFQAKRLRGAYQRSTADMIQSLSAIRPLDAAALQAVAQAPARDEKNSTNAGSLKHPGTELAAWLGSTNGQQALEFLQKGEAPAALACPPPTQKIKAALDAVENLETDAEVGLTLKDVSDKELEQALRQARDCSQEFDKLAAPINKAVDKLEGILSSPSFLLAAAATRNGAESGSSVSKDFTAARLKYTAQRYETEARLNQTIANLYELQVRKSNLSAERHHFRSQRFFFGMLAAQLAVIISTVAMAARQRNLLWSLAAGSGLIAVIFAIYVYLKL